MAPERPFFVYIGREENPRNLLWIAQPFPRAAPSHSWVEVTHCSVRQPHQNGAPAWRQKPMWMYVAPGSGISIDIGKTHVVHSYQEAMDILASFFTGEERGTQTLCPGEGQQLPAVRPLPEPVLDGMEWYAPIKPVNRSTRSRLRARDEERTRRIATRERSAFEAVHNGRVVLEPIRRGEARVNAAALDSLQIVRHGEWYSGEIRHELIMLRYDECSTLDENIVKCGRYPHLFPCSRNKIFQMRLCEKHNVPSWDYKVDEILSEKPRNCEEDASDCYLSGGGTGNATYFCPMRA